MLKYVMVLAGILAFLSMKCSFITLGYNEHIHVDTLKVLEEIDTFREFVKYEPEKLIQIKKEIIFSEQRGELTALFTESEEMREIAISFPGDSGIKYIEFVFRDNDNLLYMLDNEKFYSAPLTDQESSIVRNIVNEYYFNENKLFYWLRDKQRIPSHYYENKSKEIMTTLKDLIHYLSRTN
jgi:hypothetical protein